MVPVIGETIVYKSDLTTQYKVQEIRDTSIIALLPVGNKWTQIHKSCWSSYMTLEDAREKYHERFL